MPLADIYYSGGDTPPLPDPNYLGDGLRRLLLSGRNVAKMYSADGILYAIADDGTLWVAYTYNSSVDSGLGISVNEGPSTDLAQIGSDTWLHLSVSYQNTFAIKSDGTLWCWGRNTNGELPVGDTLPRYSPVQVGVSTWGHVTSFGVNMLAIKSDGTLWAYGANDYGSLGLGHTSPVSSLTQVGLDSDWEFVATHNHTLAVKSNGTLWSCGYGLTLELGYGSANTSTLAQVGSDTNWATAVAAQTLSLALKTDGSLYVWGTDSLTFRLGLGPAVTSQSGPARIGTDLWESVAAWSTCVVALRANGAVWGWGSDRSFEYYPLGMGTNSYIKSPIQLSAENVWFATSNGQYSGVYYAATLPVFWTNFSGQYEA